MMNGETLWNQVVSELSVSAKEVQTTRGFWFKASSHDGKIVVNAAADHEPRSKLSMPRTISKKEFLSVYFYYEQWQSGEPGIRQVICKKSRNSAYILALIQKALNG
ncbi:MAG: hypothetical protein ACFWUC_01740 [Oscillospiraceae bacterium]